MSTEAARVFSQEYLMGFFDMVSTMVSEEASYELDDIEYREGGRLSALVAGFGAALMTPVKEGGFIGLLMSARDAYAISAAFMGDEVPDKDAVAPEDVSGLQEVYDPCMGAGISVFKERYGKIIALDPARVASGKEAARVLGELAPQGAHCAAFQYALPSGIEGQGMLLFTRNLEGVILPESIPVETTGSSSVEQDIPTGPAPMSGNAGNENTIPPNLDMVLDIRLVVKARLGRIEMPINEILGLGPGSIVEVGHLVDEPIELLVNDKLIARGDVVVVDEKFGLRITEIVSPKERIESLR